MLFKPATPEVAYLKVGLYGLTGSGKTLSSLLFATALGRTVIFDTESSGSLYAPKKGRQREIELPSFDREATQDITRVTEGILQAYQEGYDAVVVDQLGHLWENAQETVLKGEEEAGSKAWHRYNSGGVILPMLWKKIKLLWKNFIHAALDTPIHVFMCGRLQALIEIGNGGSSVKYLGDRMAGEKEVMYEPTILFKMERMPRNNVKAVCEKDKTGYIQGKLFINPRIDIFADILKYLGKASHIKCPKGVDVKVATEGMHPSAKLLINLAVKAGYTKKEVTEIVQALRLEEIEAAKVEALHDKFPLFIEKKGGENKRGVVD